MEQLVVPGASRYRSHGFRRGATQELMEGGSPWSVVASSGLWHSHAFRGYLYMSKDVELGAQQMFEVDFDSASDAN